MTDFYLIPHPKTPPRLVQAVNVAITAVGGGFVLTYVVEGPTAHLAMPVPAKPYRTDALWKTTCLELFVGQVGEQYLEFNFSPSSQWAAYRFSSYRDGGEPLEVDAPPSIHFSDEGYALILPVLVELPTSTGSDIGLSAVIEETDGTKSYWALAHAPGPPDFHNRDCFIATLPAPDPA